MDKKAKFLQTYANLPLALRKEIIVVVDEEPLTWNAAKIEIENDTQKGKEILEKLFRLKILK
ncbi:unnamed protein product [marine sediment metagenome]|uniref:Uncharacterized protein n=1 Tax=marine sediment metagenome TaxID=412755 RepID=X0WUF7_9ZZZZ